MNKKTLCVAMSALLLSANTFALTRVSDEASLRAAVSAANADSTIKRIVFKRNAEINLSAPVVYTGPQSLSLVGNGAVIDGSNAGSFVLDEDLTAVTQDGTLVFNTAGNIRISKLTVENSATRGVVVNIPDDAEGDNISVMLYKVSVLNSALYGVHIDDNADEFDDGSAGSAIGVDLRIFGSTFVGNGTGAIDFDGVRVDERAEGDINSIIFNTTIDFNGGDGIELDEAGSGDVNAAMLGVTINDNGFYNEEDLDDAFDIDEADGGDINVFLYNVEANNNMDEGLDFDEEGEGSVNMSAYRVSASGNSDEGIKIDEEDAGDVNAELIRVSVSESGDDAIQVTELGEGRINAGLVNVTATDNAKYGVKMEQWVVEDEEEHAEEAGSLTAINVTLSGNGKGDEISTNNINVE